MYIERFDWYIKHNFDLMFCEWPQEKGMEMDGGKKL